MANVVPNSELLNPGLGTPAALAICRISGFIGSTVIVLPPLMTIWDNTTHIQTRSEMGIEYILEV